MAKALPEKFTLRMKAQLGAEYDAFIAAYELPPVRGIRINTLKLSKERFLQLCPWSVEQSPTLDEGLILCEDVPHIGSHPFHIAGMLYVQEPSAMSVIDMAEISPGMRVLDLCAAPGGKSGGIAARLRGSGLLVSNEIVPARARQLARNLERLGAVNSVVTCARPDAVSEALPRFFDRVIVDAPCSGEGMFRKDDTAIEEWSPEHVASCAARQRAILESAEKCVREGGRLIYSTCTFSPEENEGVIEAFLSKHPEYSLETMRRLYPHTSAGEGHFAARLIKAGASAAVPQKVRPGGRGEAARRETAVKMPDKQTEALAASFFDGVLSGAAPSFSALYSAVSAKGAFSERLLYCPFEFPKELLLLPIVSFGAAVGERAGRVFKPSHSFFMAAHGLGYRNGLELAGDPAALPAFLRGEALSGDAAALHGFDISNEYSRYMPVCVHGCPVGFGKLSDGCLKNHLPKGLIVSRSAALADE